NAEILDAESNPLDGSQMTLTVRFWGTVRTDHVIDRDEDGPVYQHEAVDETEYIVLDKDATPQDIIQAIEGAATGIELQVSVVIQNDRDVTETNAQLNFMLDHD
ncbi:MAG TPA: hypothetical protein VGB67_00200, partial [Fibrella sp.]